MDTIVQKIIEKNLSLFGPNPSVEKINIGFTNTLYSVNDTYIIKICTDINNEEKFKKEISFYETNKDNTLIPKLYYFSTDKKDVPYYYEIMEKVEGVSLYHVWHTYTEKQREDIIRQLCDAMKQIHNNKGESYDWVKEIESQFISLYNIAKEKNIINEEESQLLNQAYSYFEKYLQSSEFVLVHNDLHFDNIFFNDEKIKIIDFERAIYAPRDFELDILYRMIRKPWKYASEQTEEYIDISQYSNIMAYIKKYYPELINIPNLYERLAIYDIIYFLKHYVQYPEYEDLKEDVLSAANIVVSKNKTK